MLGNGKCGLLRSWVEPSGPRLLLQADDYIHANEVILTFGMSETTSLFLQEAARKRDFQVGGNMLCLQRGSTGLLTW